MPNDFGQDHAGRAFRTLEHCALLRKTVRLTCRRCGHVSLFDAVQLWWRFYGRGWDDRLTEVPAHMACSGCPKAAQPLQIVIAVTDERPEQRNMPYPSEREWKRVVSRFRS